MQCLFTRPRSTAAARHCRHALEGFQRRVPCGEASRRAGLRKSGPPVLSFDPSVVSGTGACSAERKSSVEVKPLLSLVAASSSQGYLATSEPVARMESDCCRSPWPACCEGVGFGVVEVKVRHLPDIGSRDDIVTVKWVNLLSSVALIS